MNILLFRPQELLGGRVLRVRGERAQYLAEVQGVEPGDVLRVGEIGGMMGNGEVSSATASEVEISVSELTLASSVPPTDLIIALPRPQTLKKVLQSASALGVRRIILIRASRVIKSYFSSPLLRPENIEEQLQLGMEQGISTYLPEVSVHDRFRPFIEDELERLCLGVDSKLFAHPRAEQDISELGLAERLDEQSRAILAVGPEGGWQEHEAEAFIEAGFRGFSIGPRVLRVETAVCALLGQLDLLRKLKTN